MPCIAAVAIFPDLTRTSHRVPAASLLKSLRLHEAVQKAVDTRRATENPADILDSMSRSLEECNVVDMVICAAAIETL